MKYTTVGTINQTIAFGGRRRQLKIQARDAFTATQKEKLNGELMNTKTNLFTQILTVNKFCMPLVLIL